MKDFEIATKITTPLMLATLALCLLFGLLKGIAAIKKPSAAFRTVIRWGFIVALVLGVLANMSADIIPEEMELLKQIEGLKESLDSCTSQTEKRSIQKQLSEKITNFNMR